MTEESIYEIGDGTGFIIADSTGFLPGIYTTHTAAQYAFTLPVSTLHDLEITINRGGRDITLADLREASARLDATEASLRPDFYDANARPAGL